MCGNGFGIRNARPASVDAFEKRARHRLAFQRFEIFFSRSASRRAADALALVHTDTGRRDFRVRFAEKRIVTAGFQNGQAGRVEWKIPVRKEKGRRVPNQPRRLPRLHESQLLRETIRVGGGCECFARQNRRRRVMAMRQLILRTKARHNYIGAKLPDDPHDVSKNFVVIPDAHRFVSRLRKPEIDCSREKLLRMIDASGIEQFLCPNNAEPLAQFRADQILAAVPARNRKISGVVK